MKRYSKSSSIEIPVFRADVMNSRSVSIRRVSIRISKVSVSLNAEYSLFLLLQMNETLMPNSEACCLYSVERLYKSLMLLS